jgi:alpha-1,6-mannosyltransferase
VRVCDITDAYHATSGGIRTTIDQKIRFLSASAEHEHVLIIPTDRDFHEKDGRTQVFGVASPRIPGCGEYRALWRERRVLDVLARTRPDVVEWAAPYLHPWAISRARRRLPSATAMTGFYHTDFPSAYVETPLRPRVGVRAARAVRKLALRYARAVHARLDLTLVSSPDMARALSDAGLPRVEVLPLGVDIGTFHPDRRDPAWRRTIGVSDQNLLLVFAGRFDREKRVDILLEMARRLPPALPWKLLFIGDGPRRPMLQRAAARDPRVLVLPFERDRQRFARCLASADIYVSAARFETFGLAVIEAQACGLPVVGQRAGAMPDRVPASTGILVDELDPQAMAEAVVKIAGGDRAALGQSARQLVATRNTWDRTFERLIGLYEEAMRTAARSEHAVEPRRVGRSEHAG